MFFLQIHLDVRESHSGEFFLILDTEQIKFLSLTFGDRLNTELDKTFVEHILTMQS